MYKLSKQSLSKGGKLSFLQLHLNRYFHLSSSKGADDKEDGGTAGTSRDWIPPQRPLSGDLGHSDVYATKTATQKTITNVIARSHQIDESILKKIQGDENAGENVTFFDLDDFDLEEFKKHLESQGGNLSKNISISSKGDFEGNNEIWQEITDEEDEDDLDVEEAFDEDEIMKEIMNDLDVDDEEMLMIEQRLEEIKDIYKKDPQKEPISLSSTISSNTNNTENSELDEFLKKQNSQTIDSIRSDNLSVGPDWLSTRRSKLAPTAMLTPAESSSARYVDGEIPVLKDTLLSSKEIMSCLSNLGAIDVNLITPEEKLLPLLGWDGLIVATGISYSHIRVLTDEIVNNLRKRNLARKGVIGALYGSEGGEDTTSSRKRRGAPKKMDDGWIAVDCGNFIVHVQDEISRRSVDLEGLWSPGERGKAGKELRRIKTSDDDAIEDYIANNPIPDEYTEILVNNASAGDFWVDGPSRGGFGHLDKRKSGRWTPASNEKRKYKNRGKK